MDKRYLIAIDEGTTSARCVLYDVETHQIVKKHSSPIHQIYPHTAWVEEDAEQIYSAVLECLKSVVEGIQPQLIYGIGITNQRETIVAWDSETGRPIYNAIVWQCRRGMPICEALTQQGYKSMIRERTGLIIDSYFSATKIKWLLDNVEEAKTLKRLGRLRIVTIDTWLIYKLTGERVFVTDCSNASRTMLFNIHTLKWDEDLMSLFGVDRRMLAQITDSSDVVGYTTSDVFGMPIPIAGIAGDQQASLFGQRCLRVGDAKNTYGTGCFALVNTGKKIRITDSDMLATVAWTINGKPTYAIEGSVFNAGSTINWLCDIDMLSSPSEAGDLARSVEDNGGVYLVPAFTGIGAPWWDMSARGLLVGMTRATTKAHIVRSALEAMAYNTKAILDVMQLDAGLNINLLKVDGGVSEDKWLMQYQSDVLGVTVRTEERESTAMGAIYLAGLSTGAMTLEWIQSHEREGIDYLPNEDNRQVVIDCYDKWREAVERSLYWSN